MDLNMMMREQARNGLQAQLDAATTEGDTVKVRKIADEIAKLDVATAPPKPAGPAYSDAEIKTQLEKADWFGVDPKKTAAAIDFGKNMEPKKFATAEAFAAAIVKAVEVEFKPANKIVAGEGEDPEDPEADPEDPDADPEDPPARKRKTDAPGELERGSSARARKGPWTKLSDAPRDVQEQLRSQESKFVPKSATKEQREAFMNNALASAYRAQQQRKGK